MDNIHGNDVIGMENGADVIGSASTRITSYDKFSGLLWTLQAWKEVLLRLSQ